MSNRPDDALFQLIKSLEKSEKRNFKLYIGRNSSAEGMKSVHLFDAIDKLDHYDESIILKRCPDLKKQQLSNIKAHLYKQVLASLRLIKEDDNIDIRLHEQMDYARILYNKGLYSQSLKILSRLKELARENNQMAYLLEALFFEKKIESLQITDSFLDRAEVLTTEVKEVNDHLQLISKLSNLSLLLYKHCITFGHARNEKEAKAIARFFKLDFPLEARTATGFYERLYMYQAYCWYGFLRQDFVMYYRATQKWVDLFEQKEFMKGVETAHYIKGMHNFLWAHFYLQNYSGFTRNLEKFEKFCESDTVTAYYGNRMQAFIYLSISRINEIFLEGNFKEGMTLIPVIEEQLNEYEHYLDRNRVLVFYYKFATLSFVVGDYVRAIHYLNMIINWKIDLRNDLQCYARLLHLLAHYEMGNFDLLEYLFKSVYRFMSRMQNLGLVEIEIFRFLRLSFRLHYHELKPEFEKLRDKLDQHSHNRFETRTFSYFDVISWLESKIAEAPLQDILRKKIMQKKESRRMRVFERARKGA